MTDSAQESDQILAFGSTDVATICFMVGFNFVVLLALCLYVYCTHDWETKSIHQEARETNLAEVEERYDQRARDAFFLNQESAQESLLLHSQFRDQSTILMKGKKKQIMPVLDLTAINRPLGGIGTHDREQQPRNAAIAGHQSNFMDTMILKEYGKFAFFPTFFTFFTTQRD